VSEENRVRKKGANVNGTSGWGKGLEREEKKGDLVHFEKSRLKETAKQKERDNNRPRIEKKKKGWGDPPAAASDSGGRGGTPVPKRKFLEKKKRSWWASQRRAGKKKTQEKTGGREGGVVGQRLEEESNRTSLGAGSGPFMFTKKKKKANDWTGGPSLQCQL